MIVRMRRTLRPHPSCILRTRRRARHLARAKQPNGNRQPVRVSGLRRNRRGRLLRTLSPPLRRARRQRSGAVRSVQRAMGTFEDKQMVPPFLRQPGEYIYDSWKGECSNFISSLVWKLRTCSFYVYITSRTFIFSRVRWHFEDSCNTHSKHQCLILIMLIHR
jgi:hypothetical protein